MYFENSISYFIYRYLSEEPYQGAKTGRIVRTLWRKDTFLIILSANSDICGRGRTHLPRLSSGANGIRR